MEGLPDELIGYVRTVKIARIDVVHAGGNGLAQNGDGAGNIVRWTPDQFAAIASGELHCPIAHAVQGD